MVPLNVRKRSGSVSIPQPPVTIAAPIGTPDADDDPHLTQIERTVLLNSFTKQIPVNAHAPFHPSTSAHIERADLTPIQASAAGEVAHRFYRNPVYEAATLWLGSLIVIRETAESSGNVDSWISPGRDIGRLSDMLERRMKRLVREGIERVNADATRFGDALNAEDTYALLQTPENLALQYALFMASLFGFMPLGRMETVHEWYRSLFSLWRLTRIPGEAGCRPPTDYSSWMLREHWLRLFAASCAAYFSMAAGSRLSADIDPATEFPTVPFPIPDTLFNSLPVWKLKPDSAPALRYLFSQAPQFTCAKLLAWLDPSTGDTLTPLQRHEVLNAVLGSDSKERVMLLITLVSAALFRLDDFSRWLRNVAGLRKLDVLLAEVLLTAPEGLQAFMAASDVPQVYFVKLLVHPYLDEALARVKYLNDVFEIMRLHLPASVLSALYNEDFNALIASIFPDSRVADGGVAAVIERLKTVASLSFFELGHMILASPEPFADLFPDKQGRSLASTSAHGRGNDATDQHEIATSSIAALSSELADDEILSVWFSTNAFLRANQHAIIISQMMQELHQRLAKEQLQRQIGVTLLTYSAIYAAWLQLLSLRRIHTVAATSPLATSSDATKSLCDDLTEHIGHCLAFLDKSGRPQAREAAAVIRGLLPSAVSSSSSPSSSSSSVLGSSSGDGAAGSEGNLLDLVLMVKQLDISDK